jgi:hypothetical protein
MMCPQLGRSVEAFEMRHCLANYIRHVVRNGTNTGQLVCVGFLKQPDVRLQRGFRVQDTNKAVFSRHEGRQDPNQLQPPRAALPSYGRGSRSWLRQPCFAAIEPGVGT